jgi:hypothetical protein
MTDRNSDGSTYNMLLLRTHTENGNRTSTGFPAVVAVAGKHICVGEYHCAEEAAEAARLADLTIHRLVVEGVISMSNPNLEQ